MPKRTHSAAAALPNYNAGSTASSSPALSRDGDEGNQDQIPSGTVVRVRMVNFMSCGDTEMRPGPGFNVVIGPNGTGKSTIVSAITLGLGGDYKSLRRQKNLAEFVNNADTDTDAEIEIELSNTAGENQIVKSRIRHSGAKGGSISYKLNGTDASKAAVRSFAEALQIQTDNLCQFLPQDVVREFPAMSPGTVLTNTIRAVGSSDMLEAYEKLKAGQVRLDDLGDTLCNKEATLGDLKRKSENMKSIRKDVAEKEREEKRLKQHKMQLKYLELTNLKRESQVLKKNLENREKEKDTTAERLRVAESALSEYKAKNKELSEEMKTLNGGRAECLQLMRDSLVVTWQQRVEEAVGALKKYDESKVRKQKQLAELEAEIQNMQKSLREMPSEENLAREKEKAVGSKSEADAAKERLETEDRDLKLERNQYSNRLERIRNDMRKLRSVDEQKLHTLNCQNQDAYKGVLFLRENNNRASFFRETVHDPVMTTIKLRNAKYAVHVQKVCGKAHLETFVCEEIADMHTLTNKLRKERKLRKINAAHSVADLRLCQTRPCAIPGFECYLSETFEAPPAVLTHLCKEKRINTVPIFSDDTRAEDVERRGFKKYFIGKRLHTVRDNSRFGLGKSNTVEDCSNDRTPHTTCVSDDDELRRVEEVAAEAEGEIKRLSAELEQSSGRLTQASETCKRCFADLNGVRESINRRSKLHSDIRERQIRKESLASGDAQEHRAHLVEQTKSNTRELLRAEHQEREHVKKHQELNVKIGLLMKKIHQVESRNADKISQRDAAKAELDEKTVECLNQETRYNSAKNRFGNLFLRYKEDPDMMFDTQKITKPPPSLALELRTECGPNIDAVRAEIPLLQVKINNMATHSRAKIAEAQLAGTKVDDQEKEVEQIRNELNNLRESSVKDKKNLNDSVEVLTERINEKFSALMVEMGNLGAVELQKNDDDFKNYGLHIMVKFGGARNSSIGLQRLSATVHSGGEKSVSTAIYMMALQELTRVPFRCVDEINQGMDVVNERRVWELLLRTAENYSAQYFYLAPKFPRQLKFDGEMRVLACMSGANRKRAKINPKNAKNEDITETHIRRAERLVKKRNKDAAKKLQKVKG